MSQWAYIRGVITVSPMGRTQPEKRYILDTVLSHLPRVTGSEGDMNVYVIQKSGHNVSQTCDEFYQHTDNLADRYGKNRRGFLRMQSQYLLVVEGSLRDRDLRETYPAFLKWLCRLAKRIRIYDVLAEVSSDDGAQLIKESSCGPFWDMFELPSWSPDNPAHTPTWCEYLMWDTPHGCGLPTELVRKYYNDPEADAEFERRFRYEYGEF